MRVTLMPNLTRDHAFETAMKLCHALETLNISYSFLPEFAADFASTKGGVVSCEELGKSTDVLIAVGGDGTMIRAAKIALPFGIPVLGINAGNLAYLMGLETDEMKLLNRLITNDYYIEERIALNVEIYNDSHQLILSDFCVNDAVFARGAEIKMVTLDVFCDDRFINRYTSDGVIIATPTGSTAYNLAAGGPIVDPGVESIILTPICPHSLVERTVLFGRNSVLKLSNPGSQRGEIRVSCDGGESVPFGAGYGAVITKSGKKTKFIRLKDETFMDILNKKMKT